MRTLGPALLSLCLALLAPASVWAHGADPHGDAPAWSFDPWIMLPLMLAAALYLCGTARLWRRAGMGRGVRYWQLALYVAGWLALAGALVSPLHWWGEHLFTAHMIEHEIVMVVAAPLLVAGRPLGAALWAFPDRLRRRLAGAARGGLWRWLSLPATATILHGLAIWVWHMPPLFDATVTHVGLHRAQHLSFLLSGLLFWWALLRRAHPAAAAGHLFITMVHTGVLGALLTFSPRVLYTQQTAHAALWGLTALEDQQIAGLVMWVPGGTVYAAVMLTMVSRWVRRSSRGWRPGDALRAR
ncbi:cytochrome c oxidase assembly protein [Roseomonas aerophila]|uniref:Cytochrome c oxidase assembly protein n=1 Tax=Teichococcus aerophilus TaxID=1224513 RepID=A0ABR7RJE7_9PROT|nr:cytochrome c oxidase assembly protein [Pseudoroseomonas aerophila]MBC9206443.1 cytochrome c oxidase assembly protein [Pseudoroseomonas aerophila]